MSNGDRRNDDTSDGINPLGRRMRPTRTHVHIRSRQLRRLLPGLGCGGTASYRVEPRALAGAGELRVMPTYVVSRTCLRQARLVPDSRHRKGLRSGRQRFTPSRKILPLLGACNFGATGSELTTSTGECAPMSDLSEDYYNQAVIDFLESRKVANARLISSVDETAALMRSRGPARRFRRIQDLGEQREDPKGGSAWWSFESNPGVTAGVGGGIWRWP